MATTEIAMIALKALLRFRERVDEILSLNEASAGLPFRLPPTPADVSPHLQEMLRYFQENPNGTAALEIQNLGEDLQEVLSAGGALPQDPLNRLFKAYFELASIRPKRIAPDADEVDLRNLASSGPDEEMRLAYFVVESHRLSRNPALTRLILAATDTLLETVGENAGLFISSPRTKSVVETLLQEFAIKHDFDDDEAERIFKRLLGSAAIAAYEHAGEIPDHPVLAPVLGAFGDVYADLRADADLDAADFFARLMTDENFDRMIAGTLTRVAEDPSFITSHSIAQEVLGETLKHIAKNVPAIRDDPKALLGALEVAVGVGASHVDDILKKRLGDQPLISAVLSSVADEIATQASENTLFRNIANQEIVADLYEVSLEAIAANPGALASSTGMSPFVSELVAGVAGTLAKTDLGETLTRETLREVVSGSLTVMAEHPHFIAGNNEFAGKVLEAVFAAMAPLVRDGFDRDDALIVVDAALGAAADNLGLVAMDDRLRIILETTARSIAEDGVKQLFTSDDRRELLIATVRAVVANPDLWDGVANADLAQPLVEGIVVALTSDDRNLLSGSALVETMQRVLLAVSRRGQAIVDDAAIADELRAFLTQAITAARTEIGRSIDGEMLPDFLERIAEAFLQRRSAGEAPAFAVVLSDVLVTMEAR